MMYPHMKNDDCWTYTSREMELNAVYPKSMKQKI